MYNIVFNKMWDTDVIPMVGISIYQYFQHSWKNGGNISAQE